MNDLVILLDALWFLILPFLAFLVMILVYFETKGDKINLDIDENIITNKYLEKHESKYIEDQYAKYRQYFDTYSYFSNNLYDPFKLILRYHQEFKKWIIINYSIESINEPDLSDLINNTDLKKFVKDPIEWFKPFFIPQMRFFYNKNDSHSIAIGIAKLIPVFKKLEKLIFFQMDIPYHDSNWQKYSKLERKLTL